MSESSSDSMLLFSTLFHAYRFFVSHKSRKYIPFIAASNETLLKCIAFNALHFSEMVGNNVTNCEFRELIMKVKTTQRKNYEIHTNTSQT